MPKIKFPSLDLLFATIFNRVITSFFFFPQTISAQVGAWDRAVWGMDACLASSDHPSRVVLCSSTFTSLALFGLGDKDVTEGKDVCAVGQSLPSQPRHGSGKEFVINNIY